MALNAYVRKEERFKVSDLRSHLSKLNKEEQSKPKAERSE